MAGLMTIDDLVAALRQANGDQISVLEGFQPVTLHVPDEGKTYRLSPRGSFVVLADQKTGEPMVICRVSEAQHGAPYTVRQRPPRPPKPGAKGPGLKD